MADRWTIVCPRFGFGVLDKLKYLGNVALVEPTAPSAARNAVETCARYFQREFGYDFVQYSAKCPGAARGLLWTEYDPLDINKCQRVVGAGAFTETKDGWCFSWVWMHPYARQRGRLRQAWAALEEHFGEFSLAWPLSRTMRAFVIKRDPECTVKRYDDAVDIQTRLHRLKRGAFGDCQWWFDEIESEVSETDTAEIRKQWGEFARVVRARVGLELGAVPDGLPELLVEKLTP